MKKIFIKSGFILLTVFLLSGCYSEYLSIDYTVHHGAVWNNDKSCVTFVASKIAYRKAKGISRFPDGGIPQYLLEDMGLYIFNIKDSSLAELVNFNDLVNWQSTSRSLWSVNLVFNDTVIYYQITPVTDWNWFITKTSSEDRLKQIKSLKQKYNKPYMYNLNTGSVQESDTSLFREKYQENIVNHKADLNHLNKILKKVPLSEWGLKVQEIYPKKEKEYIKETIYRYNECAESRRAVVEQIIAKKNKQEIEKLLEKMDKYRNSLEGLERMQYDLYTKETYDQIKTLL